MALNEFLTFLVFPFIVGVMCILNQLQDEDRVLNAFNIYTIAIQVQLIFIYIGRRYCCICCRCCCKSVRPEKEEEKKKEDGDEMSIIPAQDQTKMIELKSKSHAPQARKNTATKVSFSKYEAPFDEDDISINSFGITSNNIIDEKQGGTAANSKNNSARES